MNVVAYVRVSTDGQLGEDKFGLEAQRQQIEAYCKEHDMNILKWVADEGVSGAKYREGFDEIIYNDDIRRPPYEAVVVAKSDRVARDINVYFYYQAALLKKDIQLISVTEDFGEFGVFANMLKAFTITCAELERENIRARTAAGREAKRKAGGYCGGRAPYGYVSQQGKLVVEPEEAKVVRLIFDLRSKGYTYKDVLEALSAMGIRTKNGLEFSNGAVQHIINNRKLYEGYIKYGKGNDWVKGQHEVIIRPQDFKPYVKKPKPPKEKPEKPRIDWTKMVKMDDDGHFHVVREKPENVR